MHRFLCVQNSSVQQLQHISPYPVRLIRVLLSAPASSIQKLQHVQNTVARIILQLCDSHHLNHYWNSYTGYQFVRASTTNSPSSHTRSATHQLQSTSAITSDLGNLHVTLILQPYHCFTDRLLELTLPTARSNALLLPSGTILQGDHLSGKPGNVRAFETCQGNVTGEKILSGKSVPKLFITGWIFAFNFIFFYSLCSQTCTLILLNLRCQ